MYRHLLMPTDGSALSYKAIVAGMVLAREIDARVTGYFALPRRGYLRSDIKRAMDGVHADEMLRGAKLALEVVSREALEYRVPTDVVVTEEATPYGGIVSTAEQLQ